MQFALFTLCLLTVFSRRHGSATYPGRIPEFVGIEEKGKKQEKKTRVFALGKVV
jgi:hypothetical protein